DITTVLLINNESGRAADSHGRFLTVRPDVGILTSTARTFVQDGITTEFATKVVGTTLNSGRLYAQYIKKNSRVVNNNDKLAPSIVTSWVGELQNTQTPIYLQNHNDLFNFNEKDWQDIDDSLLVKQDEFVGNTDFVIVQTTKVLQSTMSNNQELINTFPTILNIRTKLNTDHSNSLLKLTDDKVLTINDLETFTVINKINPTPYPHRKMSTELFIPNADKKKEQERNGKFVNNQNSIASDFHISKRILATTTYYGFAEFTTVVGNSVIVFSPSTLQINPSFGNVTSIKGNPTLRPDSTKIQTSQDVSVITNPKGITNKNTFDILANDVSQLKSMTYSGDFSSISETDIQANQINISKLYIEESISNLYLGYIQSNTSKLEDVVPTGAHYIPLRNESRLHILEGATTVFVDDDPFTNFMDLIRTSDPILNRSHLTINETSYIPTTLNGNEINNSFIELNINKNYDIKTCDHTTSQVFLTQIVKRLNDSLVNSTNPLQDYNIVETTKYYCIQATQVKSKAEIKDVTAFQNTESSGELMSTEVDETTLRDPEEYNLTTDNEYDGVDDEYDIGTDDIDLIFKTLFTTYTYLTTFFEGSQTTLSSHTEIITNIVSSTYASNFEDKSENLNIKEGYQFTERVNDQTKYALPQEIISLLVSYSSVNSSECDSSNEATQLIDDLKYTKTFFTTYTYYTSIFTHNETEVMSRTEVITNYATDNKFNVSTSNMLLLSQKRENKIHTPFINSSSLDIKNKDNKKDYHEDQVSSESNTDEILPSATLLLQTSFTTFTFYTTMYVGEDINVISRLETVTNVATETLQPTKTFKLDEVSFPITYFTTFTYWTKLAKDGNISTISREETLSNVIQATSTTTEAFNNKSFKNKMSSIIFHANISQGHGELEENANSSLNGLNILSDITTYYTTYTYYTTSYEVNNTIIDSRFETITNIITTSGTFPSIPSLELSVSQTDLPLPKTDYPIQPNTHNLILYDCKHIIDADEVSTLYFTTEIFSSENSEGYDIEITSSTSRLQIDETKKSILATKSENSLLEESLNMLHKTGLVRLIEGTRIQNSTTTLYQSKVIGTLINNRYAQIIESTSSLLFEKLIADNSISTSIVEPTIGIENNETNEAIILEEHSTSMEIGDIKNDKFPIDSPQTTKRIFAPVIRPFASRNRPTFAPKQKTQSPISATIITRSDITPTITATPALKSIGRYSSSRRVALLNSSNYLNESSTQLSRRHFGRPTKPSSFSNENNLTYQSSLFSQTKNRFSSSLRATPVLTTRRQSISYRPSNNAGFRGSGISLNSKLRIRPTSLETVQSDGLTQSETYIREGVSDVSTEEENSTDRIFNISNEEESTKRIQNPLLRFRRPINKPSGFLPSSRTSNGNFQASSIRHNPLLARSKISALNSTATTTTKSVTRNVYRPNVLQPRSRPQSNLFPPRGLFQPQSKEENSKYLKKQNDSDNDSDNDSVYNEEEADEFNDRNEDDGKIHLTERSSQVVARRKISTRVRRQAETINRSRFRFRHQNVTMPILREDERLSNPEVMDEFTSNFRGKSNSRFGSKFPSLRGQQMYSQSILVNSTTLTHHKTIRPTRPTSKRPQFTLREKDTSPNRARSTNNFRRQSTKGNSSVRRPVGSKTGTSTSHRIKNYNSYNNNGDSGRLSSTPRSRIGNNNVSKRGRGSIRSRNRNEYATDMQPLDQEDAIITVTHFIPVEVTIPVVNGHVTDYKNIVTAKTSIELIGPNQYTDVVGTNGLKSTYLNRDETTINAAGLTELTKYLLHEVITSTVTFTPTTIRGRKTSFSHILPSTAYSVEYVVSTIQPQISANAPLANILLSQLLLGNLNLGTHPIIGALGQQNALSSVTPTLADPVTEYRTHTSTYVTTIFDGRSTIIPVTFQGKKILTTVYDTTAQTITATEYSIDTIVNTPTIAQNMQSAGTVNSLLLQQLLQQEQFSLPQHNLKILPDHIMLSENLQDLEVRTTEKSDIIDEVEYASKSNDPPNSKNNRKKSRKGSDGQKRNKQHKYDMTLQDSSVVTLYISGRRPGEFSTVLSTIQKVVDHSASLQKREVNFETQTTVTLNKSKFIYNAEDGVINISEFSKDVMSNPLNDLNGGTASLESIVGDVHFWYAQSNKKS
ncbi:hypothetical protein KR018_009470, partial [Drosophila ironensis]